jgi:integrase
MNSDVLAAFNELRGDKKKPAGRVFPIANSRGWFESARAKSGVKDFRWRDCRHTFCSRPAMAGVSLKTIQVLAGHKTISITAKYAHLAPNTLHTAVELVTQIPVKIRYEQPQEQPSTKKGAIQKSGKKGTT